MNLLLDAKDVHKSYYSPSFLTILKGINLQVARGQTVAIMGRSGEGKSTLLHILGTLEYACKGTLHIADQLVNPGNAASVRNKHIGFVFQSFHLLDDYTVIENVLFPAMIARQSVSPGSPAYHRAMLLLDKVGLTERAHYLAKTLSGGEKQRVAIARALMNNPDLLLADEPSGNLDGTTAENIHSLLLQFAKEQNKGLILVTHDIQLAKLCDSLYVLKNGQLEMSK